MAKRETLEKFARNLHKFAPIIQKRIVRDWQNFAQEAHAEAANKRAPFLTGQLSGKSDFQKARITAKGVESFIIFEMPYAGVIESGERNGESIKLRPLGVDYWVAPGLKNQKKRVGEIGFLSKSIEANRPETLKAIMDSVGKAWDLI